MPHVLIIHEVEAYPAWKAVFDQAAGIRKRAGEISYQLLRYDNEANRIVHFSAWSSLDNARRFFESPELIEIRRQAGVKAPEFIYLHEIERGLLQQDAEKVRPRHSRFMKRLNVPTSTPRLFARCGLAERPF